MFSNVSPSYFLHSFLTSLPTAVTQKLGLITFPALTSVTMSFKLSIIVNISTAGHGVVGGQVAELAAVVSQGGGQVCGKVNTVLGTGGGKVQCSDDPATQVHEGDVECGARQRDQQPPEVLQGGVGNEQGGWCDEGAISGRGYGGQ